MKPSVFLVLLLCWVPWGCVVGSSSERVPVGPGSTDFPGGTITGPGGTPARESIPLWEPELGQRIRATVGTFPPFVGEVRGIRGDVLLLREENETHPLRLSSIRRLEVRRTRRTRALEGGGMGAVTGAVMGRVTLAGIGGDHWESQGRILAPGLGAILGGLVGAVIGSRFGGDWWQVLRIPDPVGQPPR